MSDQPLLSVCMPTYEMGGVGHVFFKESLDILVRQTFKDFEVVVSDYSPDTLIKDLCKEYADRLNIRYHKNTDPLIGMSSNTNNAIKHATGKLLKILFQDDFLYSDKALAQTVQAFDLEKDTWLVTACIHTKDGKSFYRPHKAHYNDKVYIGNNTIGSPSVLTIKNDHPLLLDVNLKWLVDCDLYKRYYDLYGKPKISNDITVVIRTGDHQITNTEATEALRTKEYNYMLAKHPRNLQLKNVTLVAVSSVQIPKTVLALELSMQGIDYGEVVLVSDKKPVNLPKGITFKKCDPIKSIDEYSYFMAYELDKYVTTDYTLTIQYDGYVLRPEKWDSTFFNYDYIAAPWPKDVHFTNEGMNVRIGNGGFSFRSKRLLGILNKLKLPFTDAGTGYFNEDGILCVYYRHELEKAGIKYAPVEVAARFSRENECEESVAEPFGFHKNKRAIPYLYFAKHRLNKFLGKL